MSCFVLLYLAFPLVLTVLTGAFTSHLLVPSKGLLGFLLRVSHLLQEIDNQSPGFLYLGNAAFLCAWEEGADLVNTLPASFAACVTGHPKSISFSLPYVPCPHPVVRTEIRHSGSPPENGLVSPAAETAVNTQPL